MIQELSPGWTADVERGPQWLFVRLSRRQGAGDSMPELAGPIWGLLEKHFVNRLVIQLDELPTMQSHLIGELVKLHKRLATHDGVLRLCGVSDRNQDVLRLCRLEDRFPQYVTREDAVMGHRPQKPR